MVCNRDSSRIKVAREGSKHEVKEQVVKQWLFNYIGCLLLRTFHNVKWLVNVTFRDQSQPGWGYTLQNGSHATGNL